MGFFSPKRNENDPQQLAIAVHELGHAWAWKDAGLDVYEIRFSGDDGVTGVRYDETDLYAYAVGCWAGFEAEDKWRRQHGHGNAKRRNASHDIGSFRDTVRELGGGLSEGTARRLARARVTKRWRQIEALAPQLVRKGRTSI
jgi:hypothetical protein